MKTIRHMDTQTIDRIRPELTRRARIVIRRLAGCIGALSLAVVFVAGCGSEASGPDDDVPTGLEVHLNGALVARAVGSEVEGHLHVHVGEYSGQFIVTAVNGAGNEIDLPATHHLSAQIEDEDIARFVQPSGGAFQGEIKVLTAGETHLMLGLWNGEPGTGTLVFEAAPIDVEGSVCDAAADLSDAPAACVAPTTAGSATWR